MDIEKKKSQLKNLKNFKNLSEEERTLKAEKDLILESLSYPIDNEEKQFAKRLLESYLNGRSLENINDKELLRQIIDQEILIERRKQQLNKSFKETKEADNSEDKKGAINWMDEKAIREGTELLMEMKKQAGFSDDTDKENDASKVIQDLEERFVKWANLPENRSNFEVTCPECSKTFLIRRRLDKEKDEIKNHPWFIEGGILFNKAIFEDLRDNKITLEMAARYLDCSIDYLYWIQKNYPINEDRESEESNDTKI